MSKDTLEDILGDTMVGYSIHQSKYQKGIGTVARRTLNKKLSKEIQSLTRSCLPEKKYTSKYIDDDYLRGEYNGFNAYKAEVEKAFKEKGLI